MLLNGVLEYFFVSHLAEAPEMAVEILIFVESEQRLSHNVFPLRLSEAAY